MDSHHNRFFITILILFIPVVGFAQHVFSQMELEYKKEFLPYDVPYVFALEDKQFVMLSELKKNTMKLIRYDQYFFEQWTNEIELIKEESAPKVFLHGDSLCLYSFTVVEDKNQIRLTFRYFDLASGEEFDATNYVFGMVVKEGYRPTVIFNKNKTMFAVYNYLVGSIDAAKAEFKIYKIGQEIPLKEYQLDSEQMATSKFHQAHLSNDGDLFLVSINPGDFKADTYYWSVRSNDVSQINNTFFFERPIDRIGEIDIIRQSPSSYFVSFSANIEDELIGFNITGYNVVLKTVMFSHNQNLRKNELEELYRDYYVTGTNQKKKHLEIPEILSEFRMVKSYVNDEKDIILLFENLEIPGGYHEAGVRKDMPWKHKSKEDKFYSGGDILMYCFTEGGREKWKKAIQRTQHSQGSGLGLSFIGAIKDKNLRLYTHESTKGGNFYIMDINTKDGSLSNKINLLPDDKFEFTKKYSCLLDENSVILCGIAPANIFKRTLMLVEF